MLARKVLPELVVSHTNARRGSPRVSKQTFFSAASGRKKAFRHHKFRTFASEADERGGPRSGGLRSSSFRYKLGEAWTLRAINL